MIAEPRSPVDPMEREMTANVDPANNPLAVDVAKRTMRIDPEGSTQIQAVRSPGVMSGLPGFVMLPWLGHTPTIRSASALVNAMVRRAPPNSPAELYKVGLSPSGFSCQLRKRIAGEWRR